MHHSVLTRGYGSCGKCAINRWDAYSSSSMILLVVVSDVVANFAAMLNDEKHTCRCIIILKHQHIKNLVSYKHIHVSKRQ